MKAAGLIILLSLCLAGCASGGLRGGAWGNNPRGEAVDGLLVGHRLMEAGEHEMALKAYLRAAGEHGINADTLSAIGSANLSLGRLGQAEKILRRALELEPDFVPALNNLGVVLVEQGQNGEARTVFQKAYALDSGQSDAIRDNLKLAIARSTVSVYDPVPEAGEFQLVRRDKGQYVLLTEL